MCDYIPYEFEEDVCEENIFDQLKEKYKNQRAHILPEEMWQPLIDKWLEKYSNPNMWFVLHVASNVNADIYRMAIKRSGFTYREVENQYNETPIYLETPVSGLNVDQTSLIETVGNMKNKNGVLYYKNIPAPVIDLLYKEVFEERLVYPERFN